MKRIFFAAAILLSLTAVSCKKCKACTTKTTQDTGSGTPQTTSTTKDYCGKDYDDAPSEGTVYQSAGGYQQTVVTTCVEK